MNAPVFFESAGDERRLLRFMSPTERFWYYVDLNGSVPAYRPDLGPCWVWTGAPHKKGYAHLRVNWRKVKAHRFAYELLVGKVPPGKILDHLCRNRACVNPSHLEPVTNRENVLRGLGITAQAARKTTCKRGHVFDTANTYRRSDGGRECKRCHLLHNRNHKAKLRAAA